MFNLDPSKLLIVLAVALIVLGPDKLPTFMRGVGKYWNEFQKVRVRLQDEMNGAISQISEVTGPLSGAIDFGRSQLKGPLGMAASFLGGSSGAVTGMTNQENTNQGSIQVSAPSLRADYLPNMNNVVGTTMHPWSVVDGVQHPTINSDPYLN